MAIGNCMESNAVIWPVKRTVFGVGVSLTDYSDLVGRVIVAAKQRASAAIDFMPVHGLVTAARDPQFREMMNDFDVVAPDGQPVRWSLNMFHRARLSDRVYGPELTRRLCEAAAREGVSIYLYGSSPEVIDKLRTRLLEWFPNLMIAGAESPPFRPLTSSETEQAIERINSSGAGIVFLGTGCPRQEIFAHQNRAKIRAVQLCVGAAFDFHAGAKKMAPKWMQSRGLEWLFRLLSEPRRLGKRYLVTNTTFLALFAREWLVTLARRGSPSAAAD